MASKYVTLADLIPDSAVLYCSCRRCKRIGTLSADEVPRPLDTPIADVKAHLRCSYCGGRDVECGVSVTVEGMIPFGPNPNARRRKG